MRFFNVGLIVLILFLMSVRASQATESVAVYPVAEYTVASTGLTLSFAKDGQITWRITDRNGKQRAYTTPMGAFELERIDGVLCNQVTVTRTDSGTLHLDFGDGYTAELQVSVYDDFLMFQATQAEPADQIASIHWFRIAVPGNGELSGTLNAMSCKIPLRTEAGATDESLRIAVMAGQPEVQATFAQKGGTGENRTGCAQRFESTLVSKFPSHEASEVEDTQISDHSPQRRAAFFTATCDANPNGWSLRGRPLSRPIDLSGLSGVRVRVHGDAQGESLKVQFYDTRGECRDYYIPIDFEGWRTVTIHETPYDRIEPQSVSGIRLYYNGIPASTEVQCAVDWMEAVLQDTERSADDTIVQERFLLLDDFEDASLCSWLEPIRIPGVRTFARYGGLVPAKFALIPAPESTFFDAVKHFETVAEIPVPYFDGQWNKTSPWTKRSYLFLTSFGADQYEQALALAKRGGFQTILLGQESWCESTGHYGVNTHHFPGGLPQLQEILRRFRAEGFRVGFHFLAASVYPPDPYLTPIPDPRLVKPVHTELSEPITSTSDFIPTVSPPVDFPVEDGGYMGKGHVLQIGNELITYEKLVTEPDAEKENQFGFAGCTRGHLGTTATDHATGETISHLLRSYGYHLYDMDTTLLDEVTDHFAQIADACDIDMIYFDGSELLQGEHWYYNAKLHDSFVRKLRRRDVFLQASSYSHYSWHLLARSASADGHDDLKAYLDERSPAFPQMRRDGMPLDIGWYYGYDPNCSLDMYEYVLGATIGYDSSMSFQTSVDSAENHPYTNEILDLIGTYEKLRLSGTVDETMRTRLRIDPRSGGVQSPEERDALSLRYRRDYRLITDSQTGAQRFQRTVYLPWTTFQDPSEIQKTWEFTIPNPQEYASEPNTPAEMALGAQIHITGVTSDQPDIPPSLVHPTIHLESMDGTPLNITWTCEKTLHPGQYLVFRPSEPAIVYGKPLEQAQTIEPAAQAFTLPPGQYRAKLDGEFHHIQFRARITLEPMKSHPISH